jgi:ribosome-associated protein
MTKRPLAESASQPDLYSKEHASLPDVQNEDTANAVRLAVGAAMDKMAADVKVFEVGELTHFTDYFVLCSGQSSRQVQAIADGVEERLRQSKVRPAHVEGYATGQWVLMDYGDFVLHVFLGERRRFYGLERLWGDAPDMTAAFVDAGELPDQARR